MPNPKIPKKPKPIVFYYIGVVIVLIALQLLFGPALKSASIKEISYSELLTMVKDDRVSEVVDQGYQYFIKGKDAAGNPAEFKTGLWRDDKELTQLLTDKNVKFTADIQEAPNPFLSLLLTLIIPMALFMFLGRMLMKGAMGAGGNAMSFGKSKAKIYVKAETGQTFDDVAGQEEAKESLAEIVDFLARPQKYSEIGAICPKGVLLIGPPGTGKTLLAKAVAGEADVPFFIISGSEFVEMFVGLGASKVRDLFKQAKEKAPCIVFIDEIDAIGKRRDSAGFGGNDEREQTLNQLLNEMDGFEGNSGVVILAATNRPEILDPALTRPGRFDRQIRVELPDIKGREDILKVHAKDVRMDPAVNMKHIAKMTAGASGAELANIINEGALRAVRENRSVVTEEDLVESVEVVIAGQQKKNAVISDRDKKMIAYHEVGHALVAALQKDAAPVTKITIIPRTSGALGYTMQVDEDEKVLMTADDIFRQITTLTGGRSAEELIFHVKTSGASNDIERATKLARAMVTRFGMTDEFDFIALETVTNRYLGGDTQLQAAPGTAHAIDDKVREIISAAHKKAYNLLKEHEQQLHDIAGFLLERETITGEEFMDILHRSMDFYGKKMPEEAEEQAAEAAGKETAKLEAPAQAETKAETNAETKAPGESAQAEAPADNGASGSAPSDKSDKDE